MKKLILFVACALMLASCGTAGSGALTGAGFGGMVGSAIGGIIGGPRGSDVGTLIGMATGAAGGAAIGAAAEKSAKEGRNYDGGYDDAVYQEPSVRNNAPQAKVEDYDGENVVPATMVEIRNIALHDANDACHIAGGDTVRLSFEIHNVTDGMLTNLVPVVREMTGNKRLSVSPAILIETLGARKGVRYTAYILAAENLKSGTAHFNVLVQSSGEVVSNALDLEVPLD